MKETGAKMFARMREEDRKFKVWFDTLPEEQQGEADYLNQEGLKLEDIQEAIATMSDTTEHPVLLTRWEIGTLAYMLSNQTYKDDADRTLIAKLDATAHAIDGDTAPSSSSSNPV